MDDALLLYIISRLRGIVRYVGLFDLAERMNEQKGDGRQDQQHRRERDEQGPADEVRRATGCLMWCGDFHAAIVNIIRN